MKIKRFDNLWTMGLILFGAILALFYVAKIFFPEWIVGIAEIPSIVAFGNFVDSHKWAYCLYQIFVSFCSGYFYYCACSRTYKLSLKQILVMFSFIFAGLIIQLFFPNIYTPYTYVMLIICSFCITLVGENTNYKTFRSTVLCFTIDIMAQAVSLEIRNIIMLSNSVNSATVTILLIDAIIWRVLLYLFFNQDKEG